MKVCIAGSRTLATGPFSSLLIERALKAAGLDVLDITEVISGGANGVDRAGEIWAEQKGIPVKVFLADWRTHGKAAGPVRNQQMADYVASEDGFLVAIWDGQSRETRDMIFRAEKAGIPFHVYKITGN